jgi:hypothetical protein
MVALLYWVGSPVIHHEAARSTAVDSFWPPAWYSSFNTSRITQTKMPRAVTGLVSNCVGVSSLPMQSLDHRGIFSGLICQSL